MFYNKRINELENKIKELTARLNGLVAYVDLIEKKLEDERENLDDLVREKLDDAIEQYDFSDAAREALESVANEATFTVNF